jgi:hypothetical protein
LKNPIIPLLVLLFTVGCNFPLSNMEKSGVVEDQTDSSTPQKGVTITVSSHLESSGSTLPYEACYWNWARKPLPEESTILQAAIELDGLSNATAIAEAYGENCIDPATNAVARFAVMETDFHFVVEVEDLSDLQTLGDLIYRIIRVLQSFSDGTFPGAHPGYVGIQFQAGDDTENAWFILDKGESAILDGKRGSDLYYTLSIPN